MSQALDLLREIRAQNARIIELLEARTGLEVTPTGVTRTPDGATFVPGTGRLGGSHAHQPDDDKDLPPGTPADAKAALAAARHRTTTEET